LSKANWKTWSNRTILCKNMNSRAKSGTKKQPNSKNTETIHSTHPNKPTALHNTTSHSHQTHKSFHPTHKAHTTILLPDTIW
jgi:hypothetical protein